MKNNSQKNSNVADFAYYFPHERLDCYQLAVDVFHWVQDFAADGDQLYRSAESVVLNIAEGCGRSGKSRRYHYEIALGSAGETCAKLDTIRRDGVEDAQQKLRRIGMMLRAMMR